MFSESHDVRIRAFVRFIKEEGVDRFADCILENEKKGVHYGYQKDYDGFNTEEEVIKLLKTGLRSVKPKQP